MFLICFNCEQAANANSESYPPHSQSRSPFAVLKGEISAFSAVPEILSQSSEGPPGVYRSITEN